MTDAARSGAPLRARIIVGLAVLAALWVVVELRHVFGPLFAALGIAYVLDPVVRACERRGWSRPAAVAAVFGVAGVLALSVATAVAVQAADLLETLMRDEDGLVRRGVQNLVQLVEQQVQPLKAEWAERARDPEFWQGVADPLAQTLRVVLTGFLGWMELAGVLLLTPIYTAYLMLDLPRLWGFVDEHLPARDRARTRRVLADVHSGLSQFLRGRVVIALLKGLLLAVALVAIGLPYAWVVGIGSGVLSVLPMIGPLLGFALGVGVALFDLDGPMLLVWLTVVFLVAELVENFVLTPWVMGEGVSLHPLTVLFCVFFWGAAFGAFGALLAIPLTIVLKIVAREYVLPQVERLAVEPQPGE